MQKTIAHQLIEIEKTQNVRILIAVESGSRAWGFASPDSDYDVRFIYVRSRKEYLKLQSRRDVIELPINDSLDINGWDLDKALRLLYKSNPTVFEWFRSPSVYMESEFADRFRKIMIDYFSPKSSLHHYLNMAIKNYREYLRTDMVRLKKYFYVLRPLLACRWILERQTPPPMSFAELMYSQLDKHLIPSVEYLLELKMHNPEIREIPRIAAINAYLDREIIEIEDMLSLIQTSTAKDWQPLNDLFLCEIEQNSKV